MIAIRVTETFLKFAFDWLKTMLGTGKADLLEKFQKTYVIFWPKCNHSPL